jgi:hypothetical protein
MSLSDSTHSLNKNRFGLIAPAVASITSLVVYLVTLRTEVGRGDSAELALQAYQLGVTHPPGYPVHTILGKLFTLFFNEPAIATNVMSAVFTCLTVGLLSLFLYEVTKNRVISLLGPLIFAFSPIVWQMAVTTEVYNVNIFFLSLSFYLLFKWFTKPSHTLLIISAVIYGVSLGSYLANLLLLPAFFI